MELTEALNRCAWILPRPKKYEVVTALTSVLIEPTDKGICITATDLEMFYQVEVEGVTANDTFTTPLKQLRDIVKSAKDVKEINWNPETKLVSVGAAKFFGLPKEEFPVFPLKEVDLDDYREVKLNNLKWVMLAQCTDKLRDTLNGVYLDTKDGQMVATDGHRLHLTKIDKVEDVKPVIVPRQAVAFLDSVKAVAVWLDAYVCPECKGTKRKPFGKLTKEEKKQIGESYKMALANRTSEHYRTQWEKEDLFKDEEGNIKYNFNLLTDEEREIVKSKYLETDDRFKSLKDCYEHGRIADIPCQHCKNRFPHALYMSDNEILTIRPIEGDFPDYHQVIPEKKSINFCLKTTRDALKSAISQTDGIRPERSNGVKLTLNGTCHLSATNPDMGEVDVEFEGKFKNLLKPLENPCEGCKDKQIDGLSEDQETCVIRSCDKLKAFNLSTLDSFDIGVNANLVTQALYDDNVAWEFRDQFGPTKLTFGEEEMAIIMPMRL